jgi:hypothetical protein
VHQQSTATPFSDVRQELKRFHRKGLGYSKYLERTISNEIRLDGFHSTGQLPDK